MMEKREYGRGKKKNNFLKVRDKKLVGGGDEISENVGSEMWRG